MLKGTTNIANLCTDMLSIAVSLPLLFLNTEPWNTDYKVHSVFNRTLVLNSILPETYKLSETDFYFLLVLYLNSAFD